MSENEPQAAVNALIAECAEALRLGNRAHCVALAERYPEYAPELSTFLDDFDRAEQRFAPLRQLTCGTPYGAAEIPTLQGHDDTAIPPPPKVGTSFGDYELLSEVARGGMGVVYKARQRSLNRIVALKMVLSGGHNATTEHERFLIEARAIARLNHPHIVPVYEVGEHGGQPYFTMEFFAGGSLRERIEELRGDQHTIARLMVITAQAIEHAHRRGILHRDLKPSNVLLNERLGPHVTDFGLAKRLDEESDLTLAGAIVGTPSYMAPEQAKAETDLTTAIDVYGLGAVLYELLTGRPPFKGNTPTDTLLKTISDEPERPGSLVPSVETDLETICLKCLEKDPLSRYRSADALAADLERWLDGKPIHARRASSSERVVKWARRQPMLAGLLGTVLVTCCALFILAGFLWQNAELRANAVEDLGEAQTELAQVERDRDKAERQRTTAQKLAAEQQKILNDQEALAIKVRDEIERLQDSVGVAKKQLDLVRYQAMANKYAADMSFAQNAWNRGELGSVVDLLDRQRPLPQQDDLRGFEWHYLWRLTHRQKTSFQKGNVDIEHLLSRVVATTVAADGSKLAAAMGDGTINVWGIKRGDVLHTLVGPANISALSFSANGNQLTAIAEDESNKNGFFQAAQKTRLESPSLKLLQQSYQSHTWTLGESADPHVAPLDFSKLSTVMSPVFSRRSSGFRWGFDKQVFAVSTIVPSPDGSLLAFGGTSIEGGLGLSAFKGLVVLWDLKAGKIKRKFELSGFVNSLAFNPAGSALAIAGSHTPVKLWDVDEDGDKNRTVIGDAKSLASCVRFSHNGQLLATGETNGQVCLWDAKTGKQKNLFSGHQATITRLSFLPDDSALVSASEVGEVNLWEVKQPRFPLQLRGAGMDIESIAFSNDGRELTSVYRTGHLRSWDTESGLIRKNIKGTTVWFQTVLSPDGKMLAAYLNGEMRIMTVATGRRQTLEKCPERCSMTFSPDGKKLATLSEGILKIWDSASGGLIGEYKSPGLGLPGHIFFQFDPDNETIAYPQHNGILLWNPTTGKQRKFSSPNRIIKVVFSRDGRLMATSSDRELTVWDVDNGTRINNIRLRERSPFFDQIAFSPDGKRLAYSGVQSIRAQSSLLRMWDISSGQEVLNLPAWKGQVKNMVFSSDGQRIAAASIVTNLPFQAASYQSTITIWNATPIN